MPPYMQNILYTIIPPSSVSPLPPIPLTTNPHTLLASCSSPILPTRPNQHNTSTAGKCVPILPVSQAVSSAIEK